MFEIPTRRTGISAKDLQRIMGSYKMAWSRLHKVRPAMARSMREPLGPFVQIDEAFVGGKGSPRKELVLVAAEVGGRLRLAHAETNDEATLERFADGQIETQAHVVTDGHAGYNSESLGERPHDRRVQAKGERRENDAVQNCDWTIWLLKRWLMGTHPGAVSPAFRHNRSKTKGVGRIAARVIEQFVARQPLVMRKLIDGSRRCRWFASNQRVAA